MKNPGLYLLAGVLMLSLTPSRLTAQNIETETLEIQGEKAKQIEQAQKQIPVEEIKEQPGLIQEVPQPLEDRELGPAEQAQLNELERKFAAGTITETEYQLEKDTLVRKSNIRF